MAFFHFILASSLLIATAYGGNYGERNSGGIGPSSAHGVGYGGTTSLGKNTGGGGGGVIFDTITQKAISGGNDQFIAQYQVR
jgi:hypothetical protein